MALSRTLVPTVGSAASGWANPGNAAGYPGDGSFAVCTGSGRLVLSALSGRLDIESNEEILGFEVEVGGESGETQLALDTFTGTNGVLLSARSGENASWTNTVGLSRLAIYGNRAGNSYWNGSANTLNLAVAFISGGVSGNDYSVEAEIYAATDEADGLAEIRGRAGSTYTHYALKYLQDGAGGATWSLVKRTSSVSETTLASYSGDIIAVGTGKTGTLVIAGSSLKGYVNGVLRLEATDSTFGGGGGVGIAIGAQSAYPGGIAPGNPGANQTIPLDPEEGGSELGWATPADTGLFFSGFRVYSGDGEALVGLTLNGDTVHGDQKPLSTYGAALGGSLDLWGGSWSPSDVRGEGFGVVIERGSPSSVPKIDSVRVIIHTSQGAKAMSREQVRQGIVIGKETELGTLVTPSVRLRNVRIVPEAMGEFMKFVPAAEKNASHHILLTEHSEGSLEGLPTYDEIGYLFASAVAAPQTSVLEASKAWRHVFTWDPRAKDSIASYSAHYGDPFGNSEEVTGMIVRALSLIYRTDGMDLSGSVLAQKLDEDTVMSSGAATTQTITQSGSGTFILSFKGDETAALTAGSSLTAAAIQTALRDLAPVNSSTQLTVTGSDGGPFTVTFGNDPAGPFKGMRQPIMSYRVVTGTPTVAVALTAKGGHTEYPGIEIRPKHLAVYANTALASLAASKLAGSYSAGMSIAQRANPVFELDPAKASWAELSEPGDIPVTFPLILQANAAGMAWITTARAGTKFYLRLLFTGPTISDSAFPHRLQIDCPVKFNNLGNFGESQGMTTREYEGEAIFDEATNTSLVITLDNGVSAY